MSPGIPSWRPRENYEVGDRVRLPNGRILHCTEDGTSGGDRPTYAASQSPPIQDGTCRWRLSVPDRFSAAIDRWGEAISRREHATVACLARHWFVGLVLIALALW